MDLREVIDQVVEAAITHERTCQCEEHAEQRRLTNAEVDALRLLFSTDEGFCVVMGTVDHICAYHLPTLRNHLQGIRNVAAAIAAVMSDADTEGIPEPQGHA